MNISIRPQKFRHIAYLILLFFIYSIVASQTLWSFSYKWTTIADHPQYSLHQTLSESAPKPYAYRLLMPAVVQSIASTMPETGSAEFKRRSQQMLESIALPKPLDDKLILPYGVLILLNFCMLLGTLFLLRSMVSYFFPELSRNGVRDVSPLIFALLLSISYRTMNGFIYDYAELFLFCAYLVCVMGKRTAFAMSILVLAVINKETAIFFPLFGMMIRWHRSMSKKGILVSACELALAAFLFIAIRISLQHLPGTATEWHFPGNIKFYFSAAPWTAMTTPHMALIALPKPSNLILFIPLLTCIVSFWSLKTRLVRHLLLLACVLNLPLFILFSYRDEFRNLSLMFPFLYLTAVHTMAHFYKELNLENNMQASHVNRDVAQQKT